MKPRAHLLAVSLAALVPAAAGAHEVLHQVEPRGAVAVKAYYADGEVLAYTQFEIYSPADPRIPYQKGRTDRSGWLSFVPNLPGKWRVKVVHDTGHGLEVQVDATAAAAGGPSSSGTDTPASELAFVLRPLLGLGVIAAVFAVLYAVYRREKGHP